MQVVSSVDVKWHTQDHNVVLTVSDNGCGIPVELQEKVFTPLFTTKPVGIGTGLGLVNRYGLRTLRAQFPDVPLVIDAGLGRPSQAAEAMEMGFDAVLLNTAVAKAGDPAAMAEGFARAVEAGRLAFEADPMEPRDMAAPSTPVLGRAFLS